MADVVERIFRERGISLWRDVSDLGANSAEEKIARVIHEFRGFVFLATENSVSEERPMIRRAELRAAYSHHREDPSFFVLPIFRIPPEVADEALKGVVEVPLSTFGGVVVTSVEEAARRAAETAFRQAYRDLPSVPLISVGSRDRPSLGIPVDFTGSCDPATKRLSSDAFPRALAAGEDLRRWLRDMHVQRVHVEGLLHLPLALALGLAFSRTSGIVPEVHWNESRCSPDKSNGDGLKRDFQLGDTRSNVLVVKVGISGSVAQDTLQALKGLPYPRGVLSFEPSGGPGPNSVSSAPQLAGWAAYVAEEIKKTAAELYTPDVRLFVDAPMPFAFLMGHWLNAAGTLHPYGHDKPQRAYYDCGHNGPQSPTA